MSDNVSDEDRPQHRELHPLHFSNSPTNEAEGQNTTSASRTKLLKNGRDPELPQRESSTDVDVDDVDLENTISSKKSKL